MCLHFSNADSLFAFEGTWLGQSMTVRQWSVDCQLHCSSALDRTTVPHSLALQSAKQGMHAMLPDVLLAAAVMLIMHTLVRFHQVTCFYFAAYRLSMTPCSIDCSILTNQPGTTLKLTHAEPKNSNAASWAYHAVMLTV